MNSRARQVNAPRRRGQGLVEYGLIVALLAVVCIAATRKTGGAITASISETNEAMRKVLGDPRRTRTGWDRN